MISHDEVLWIIYFMQLITGVLGNSFLFCIYNYNFMTGYKKRPIDPILIHLAFVNDMFLLLRGIPQMIRVWRQGYSLNDIECKLITYFQRVFRGLSLSSTSLLSVFQAIIISPTSLFWGKVKSKAPNFVLPCGLLCWIFNLLIDVFVLVYVTGPRNNTTKERMNWGYCSLDTDAMSPLKVVIWKTLYDFIFVAIMACSSIYMVFFLYRHHQQVKHIHHTSPSLSASPEIQATKSILLLVSSFVCFNAVSGPFILHIERSKGAISWAYYVSTILSVSFQSVSPFVLLSSDTQIPRSFCIL
ncbi:vomeronasal 1 receptor monDomV1R1272 [Monodelphis domestica]|uniref:Vomeronasal type-1 receptor n=1 Tax=Monodelphis domestica TaxID=13616 RepID=A0A5F8HED0_MONDO|nr:vomeronasal 1 receptor monDomV1R1272 [Monodelphis domestica]